MKASVRKLLLIGAVAATVAISPALHRRALGQARGELFGAPPPPPQVTASAGTVSAPAVAIAPPVPYRFAGRVRKGAEEEFLLSKGELVFPVKEGDTLDGTGVLEWDAT